MQHEDDARQRHGPGSTLDAGGDAVMRAAFLAADHDSCITAADLEHAARLEYEGLGKIAT